MKRLSFFGQITFPMVVVSVMILCSANLLPASESTKKQMKQATIDGVQLEYEVKGTGDPVVLIHAGVLAEWFEPLLAEGTLQKHFQVLSYHRVGYAGSSRVSGPVSIAQQAKHVVSLMNHLGIKRAHLIGHSSGGSIALQAALDAPEAVQTLVLLEPALKLVKSAQERAAALAPVHERYSKGDKAGAIDGFMGFVTGPDYRTDLDRLLPGAFDQAVANADTFFGQELPALREWSFDAEIAGRITQPALAVIGEKNLVIPMWKERQEMLLAWLPNVKPFVLSGANHLLHAQNPRGMVEALLAFFAAHPIADKGTRPSTEE